jgi:radical SAM protein with 4Fe4S-binding SPASM domain
MKKVGNYISTIFNGMYKGPRALLIELTNECNADCVMCGRSEVLRDKHFMEFELFEKIVSDAKANGIKIIQLSFYGEPLLYPNLKRAVKFVRTEIPDATIVISTNALLLEKNLAKELIESGLNLFWISIDGSNQEEFEQIRKGLNWKIIKKNVVDLHSLIITNNYNAKIFIRGLNTNGFTIDKDKYHHEWASYADLIYIRDDHDLTRIKKESLLHKLSPCGALYSQMVILANGDVTMCFYDWGGEMVYGKYPEKSIKELWKTGSLVEKRINHLLGLKNTISFCNNCTYRAYNW